MWTARSARRWCPARRAGTRAWKDQRTCRFDEVVDERGGVRARARSARRRCIRCRRRAAARPARRHRSRRCRSPPAARSTTGPALMPACARRANLRSYFASSFQVTWKNVRARARRRRTHTLIKPSEDGLATSARQKLSLPGERRAVVELRIDPVTGKESTAAAVRCAILGAKKFTFLTAPCRQAAWTYRWRQAVS